VQIDAGHARGIETVFPELLFEKLTQSISSGQKENIDSIKSIVEYYNNNKYTTKKVLYYGGVTEDVHYKQMTDEQAIPAVIQFYNNYKTRPELKEKYIKNYWGKTMLTRSSFMKLSIVDDKVEVRVYRNDARGGPYILEHIEIL